MERAFPWIFDVVFELRKLQGSNRSSCWTNKNIPVISDCEFGAILIGIANKQTEQESGWFFDHELSFHD